MSSRCQCLFSRPADTILGCHRDPITSEKGWLDFAVRELSRVAAGKARGQEAVWRSQCKPAWWDSVCVHPWKNPTANPKDCKDTLKTKFECLVQHLRNEGQLPSEMEEEITLWEADRKSEVFLMTSFSSLLGQASNLHYVLGDACRKMEDSDISVASSILTDLQGCLSACADKLGVIKNITEQRNKMCQVTASCSGRKHPRREAESNNLSQPPSKRPKLSSAVSSLPPSPHPSSTVSTLLPSPSSSFSSSTSPQSVCINAPTSPEQQVVLAILNKKLKKSMAATTAAVTHTVSKAPRSTSRSNAKKTTHPVRSKLVGRKNGVPALSQRSPAVVADSSLTACLPATVSDCLPPEIQMETTEFRDFLNLDLEDKDDLVDCNFFDDLLQQKSPCVGDDAKTSVTSNVQSSTAPSSLQIHPAEILHFQSNTLQNENRNHVHVDPFLGHNMSENEPFRFDVENETVADRQLDSGEGTTENSGTVLCADARDRTFSDTEIGSDSGYHSESTSASHRDSLDSDIYSHSDLNSPDLEAYLDSL